MGFAAFRGYLGRIFQSPPPPHLLASLEARVCGCKSAERPPWHHRENAVPPPLKFPGERPRALAAARKLIPRFNIRLNRLNTEICEAAKRRAQGVNWGGRFRTGRRWGVP